MYEFQKLPDFEPDELEPRLAVCRFLQDDSGITQAERDLLTDNGKSFTAQYVALMDELVAALARFDQPHLKAYWVWRKGTNSMSELSIWAYICDVAIKDLDSFAAEVKAVLQEVFERHRKNW